MSFQLFCTCIFDVDSPGGSTSLSGISCEIFVGRGWEWSSLQDLHIVIKERKRNIKIMDIWIKIGLQIVGKNKGKSWESSEKPLQEDK